MLFTDIAGSSRLWEQYGDGFIPVWQAHDAVLRDAFARFGGYEVKSEGDSFMVAFSDSTDALHCALFAQAALTRYPWPKDIGAPRVRIGLHTGRPFLHENDYFGPTVNRAAHICAAAHGGQVLLSAETFQAMGDHTDPKIEFQDLGELRLKDMNIPQRLYQAQHPSVETQAFLPPCTLEGQPHNLPIQRTSFVGRAKEIEQIAAYLAQGEKPVLTLTGPGGIGKTRLSLQAAAAKAEWFPDGVWYVRLVEAKDVTEAILEIAAAMNIPLHSRQPPLDQVRAWLADRRCLLILDDAGALPQAAGLIREMLSGSSNLRCLATARESLQIDEAEDLPLTGLSLSSEMSDVAVMDDTTAFLQMLRALSTSDRPLELLTETDAGRLFLERFAVDNPQISLSAAEIAAAEALIAMLEGVPNSIERATALMAQEQIPPSVVLEWLNQRLTPDRIPPRSSPSEKFRHILRRSAQKVYHTVGETTKASVVNLGQLLQGIANVATHRKDALKASELGRQSLELSRDAGDTLGVAEALRQLAHVRWDQGDRQSALAMLSAATEIYRSQDSPVLPEIYHELERMREQLGLAEGALPVAPSVENAVAMALNQHHSD
jgi:class 3 adenylate cyclase/tetratricopeptide (TPR) repeat protein